MPRTLIQREKNILVIAVIISVVYFFYLIVILPLKKKSDSLDKIIHVKQQTLRKNIAVIQKAEGLGREYDPFLEVFHQAGTNEQLMSTFLKKVESLAGEHHLYITEIKPNKIKESEYFNYFSINLSFEGKFDDLIHFFYDVQSRPHLFNVGEMRIFRESGPSSPSQVKARCVLNKIAIKI